MHEERKAICTKIAQDVRALSSKKVERIILVLGDSREGKSAVCNFLAMRELTARRVRGILRVFVDKPVEGMELNHDSTAQEILPYQKYDHRTKTVVFDTPGFQIYGEPVSSLRIAYIVNEINRSFPRYPIYVLLVASENSIENGTGAWINCLKHISSIFGPTDVSGFSLVITKSKNWISDIHGEDHAREALRDLSQKLLQSKESAHLPVAKRLSALLTKFETNPMLFFPAPTEEGAFFNVENCDTLQKKLYTRIFSTTPFAYAGSDWKDYPEVSSLIAEVLPDLLDQLFNFVKGDLSRRVSQFITDQLRSDVPADRLQKLSSLEKELSLLIDDPTDFWYHFEKLICLLGIPFKPLDWGTIGNLSRYLQFLGTTRNRLPEKIINSFEQRRAALKEQLRSD